MFRTISSPWVTLGLPAMVVAFLTLGFQTYSLYSQLFFSAAAVSMLFASLVLAPAFFERYNQVRVVYMRRLAIQARQVQQRQQYYVLSTSLRTRQVRAGRMPVWLHSTVQYA